MQRSWADRLHKPDFALHLAARDGDIAKLRELIGAKQHDLERVDYHCGTPLHTAIIHGRVDAVQVLLCAGADPESLAPNEYGDPRDSALTLAARLGQRDIAKVLWDRGVSRGIKTPGEKLTALEIAAFYGFAGLTRDFLDRWEGWEPEAKASALSHAASRWHADVIQILLENVRFEQGALDNALLKGAGPKPMMPNEERTGVQYTDADFVNHGKMIGVLLDAGASTNAKEPFTDRYAIHIAAGFAETIEGLKVLLQRGADANVTDSRGRTALSRAAAKVSPSRQGYGMPRSIHHEKGVKALLQHGASVSIPDNAGETAINIVAYHGTPSILQLCMDKCSNPWPKNVHGETLLHAAAAGNQVEIVQALLAAGADVNEASTSGWTAIIFAVSSVLRTSDAVQITRVLLSHGANVNDASMEGWTAMHRVADLHDGHGEATELAEHLLSLGADTEARAVVPGRRFGGDKRHALRGHRLKRALIAQAQEDPGGIMKDQTPLHWAAETGSVGVVKTLLRYGANPSARDSTGATPALRAAKSQHFTYPPYDVPKKQQVIRLLFEAGADLTDEDNEGMSINEWAISLGLPLDWIRVVD